MKKNLRKKKLQNAIRDVEADLTEILTFEPRFISDRALFNFKSGGKRIRPVFVVLVAEYFNKYDAEVIRMAAIMELVHMSSLIHDDVNDRSDLRRGQATINATDGNDVAIFIGDYILGLAMQCVRDYPQREAILEILAETAIQMAEGEIIQLQSYFDVSQTLDDYKQRIARKTALLIAISCKIGALVAGANAEEQGIFYEYGYHLGMAFQIQDDFLDLLGEEDNVGKPIGHDLETGLVNMPTIYALAQEGPERDAMRDRIRLGFPQGQEDVEAVRQWVIQGEGMEATRQEMLAHVAKAKEALGRLEKRPVIQTLLEGADYVHERTL